MSTFTINGTDLLLDAQKGEQDSFQIESSPRPYTVKFYSGEEQAAARLQQEILAHPSPLLLVDKWIFDNLLSDGSGIKNVPCLAIEATEQNKDINSVLMIIDFLESHGASKTSMLYAVGGGIIQDLGAFSAYMYKRGIPWTFVPTTLLAQGDSCVGGKTALNYRHTKNLLALFSAPRMIIADTGFLSTLSTEDWLSGGGEILRLCITGGEESLHQLELNIEAFVKRDPKATSHLIRISLLVKKAVVEHDEFELDLRRAMNYGHSFGHALEALSDYRIPHGVGVTLGILVENEISFLRGILPKAQRDRILSIANRLVSNETWDTFANVKLDGILDLLKRDKKTEGAVLKLATLSHIGNINFINLALDAMGEAEVRNAHGAVIRAISAFRHE